MYSFASFDTGVSAVIEWLKKELGSVRTGRATPLLLDGVKVDMYGSLMPIPQCASVMTEDARTLVVSPWDKGQIKAIEKALTIADLGVSLSTGDTSIRVGFPQLTSERRDLLIKTVKEKLEDARISLKGERTKVLNDIDTKQKAGEMSEDEQHRYKADVQKKIDTANEALATLAEKKEEELNS